MYVCIYLLNLRMILDSPTANDLYIIFSGLEFPLFFVHVARALNLFYLVKVGSHDDGTATTAAVAQQRQQLQRRRRRRSETIHT